MLRAYLFCAAVLMLAGCGSSTRVDGGAVNVSRQETVTAPTVARETRQIVRPVAPDSPVVETVTRIETGGETRTVIASGDAKGASAQASGDGKIAQDLQTGAPNLNLGEGITGSGGEVDSSSQASAAPKTWGVWAVGVLALLAAGGLLYLGQPKAAIIAGGLGVGLIAVGFFPSLLLWALLIAAAVGIAAWVWSAKTGKSFKEAVRAITAGVETLPDDTRRMVKDAVAPHADDADKAVITRIKREDGL
jgi:hypothetical protein